MKAHHTRIKFLFNLLFNDLENTKNKPKIKNNPINKEYKNMRRRIWRKEINCWQSDKKYKAKRKQYGNIQLNPKFLNSHGHHVDMDHIINIPKGLHTACGHCLEVPESMIEINWKAFKFLFDEMTNNGIGGKHGVV